VGILYLWSVFRADIVATFKWTDEASAMVASYMLLSFVAGNLIGGFLNDKKGPKLTVIVGVVLFSCGIGLTGLLSSSTVGFLYLTYCVIGGLGSGFGYIACISCIQKWLPHRRGVASGLAVSAFGLSTVVFAPLSKLLIESFRDDASGLTNFRSVFFVLAGIFLIVGLIATLFVRLPGEAYLKSLPVSQNIRNVASQKDYSLSEAAKTARFWYLFLFIFFINGTWNLTVPLIKGLGLERGLTETAAVFAVSFTGISNSAGRLIMASLSDRIGRVSSSMILVGITLVGALSMTFIAGVPYIVVVAAIAFGYGGPAAINAAICTDFFGPKNSGTNYGVIMLALGLSAVSFNWISGHILSGSVISTFVMAAITAILAGIFMLAIGKYLSKLKSEQDTNQGGSESNL
jgi:OFA family oxalate/formate antiporter-like MFS transporter